MTVSSLLWFGLDWIHSLQRKRWFLTHMIYVLNSFLREGNGMGV